MIKNLIFLFILLGTVSCEEDLEIEPREYPRLKTIFVEVSSEEVVFSAEIVPGEIAVLEYGFLWDDKFPSEVFAETLIVGTDNYSGNYHGTVDIAAFSSSKEYYVRPYVKDGKFTVLGKILSFGIS